MPTWAKDAGKGVPKVNDRAERGGEIENLKELGGIDMKRRLLAWVLALSMVAVLAGCGGSPAPSQSSEPSEPSTSEPAVGGGKMVVYSPNGDNELENILDYFGEKYGITIELQSMGTGECYAKLDSEKANPMCDVLFGGINYGYWLQYPDLFEEYYAKGNDQLTEAFQNPNGYITLYETNGSCLLVNTDLEKEMGLEIKGYKDLLDPKLKGLIGSSDPTASSSAYAQVTNILLAMGGYENDEAWNYLDQLADQLDGKLTSGSSAVYKGVYNGEYVVGLTYELPCVTLLQDGAENVRIVYPEEGAVWLASGSAIVKGAANMDNAKLFMDFLVSDECQEIIAEKMFTRPASGVDNASPYMPSFNDIHVIYEDTKYTFESKDKIMDHWNEIWTK